jgi:hypothetical protein
MRTIAVEESRHAALSWAIDAWAQQQLSARQRRAIDDARERSVADLRRDASLDDAPEIRDVAGMPNAEAKERLLRPMETALFGHA